MRYLPGDDVHPVGHEPSGWIVGGFTVEVEPPGPLTGIEQVLQGLSVVNDWLDRVREGTADPVDHTTLQGLLVGLGHVDAAALAALSGAIVQAEVSGCAAADGQASPTDWVAQQLRMTGAAASRACRLAADLDDLPQVTADLREGRISRDHATTLAAALRQQRLDQEVAAKARRAAQREQEDRQRAAAQAAQAAAADEEERERLRAQARREEAQRRAAAEEEERRRAEQAERDRQRRAADLLDAAKAGGTPEDVAAESDRQRATDPDALLRDEAAQRARRSVRTWRGRQDGMGHGHWALPLADHERLEAALEAARTFDDPDCEPDERRTFEQRQADAFVDVIDQSLHAGVLPTSRGQKPHVTVTVPLDVLAGAQGTATTRFGTTLSAQAARRIACDAAFTRMVLSATSQVLDVGRETRDWTTAQYKAAEHTFGGCAFPTSPGTACGSPPGRCDLHHVQYWRDGGRTDQDNGVLLCRRHHDAVHHDGWTLTYDHPGQTVTVSRTRHDGNPLCRTVRFGRPVPPPAPDRLLR